MARPPLDPVEHLPAEDAYRVSARDMMILQDALYYKARAEVLKQETASLRQIIDRMVEEARILSEAFEAARGEI